MNSIILHISDLHVSLDEKYDGEAKNHDSYLSANEDNDKSLYFIECFIDFTKKQIEEKEVYLIITGDITDWGEQLEFEYAEIYLNKIINELGISRSNVLLIPGDHDLNRRAIENQLAKNPSSKLKEINEAKFTNFKNFYKSFLKKEFNPNLTIFDNLIIEKKIQLLGINSSYKIDLKRTEGTISIESFEDELINYNTTNGLRNIFCCHHNFLSSHDNKKSGQWEVNNRARLLTKLLQNSINFVFSGNEHTSSLEKYSEGEILSSDSGPLSNKKSDSSFKIYEINITDDIVLTNCIYGLVKTGAFENPYHWEKRTNSSCKQDEVINVFLKNKPNNKESITEIPSEDKAETNQDIKTQPLVSYERKVYYNSIYSDKLYKIIRELNIFHSGHFHWSESSRAHNWIDTSKLIENKENLNFLKNAIIDVLETHIKQESIDLIIGLGYEGNILATKAALKYSKPYSFLPYSYRHDEHHFTETNLNFNNSNGDFKKVLIITDVVNDGRTIRKLVNKRQKEFFINVEKIYVISLFYTGETLINHDILNFNMINNTSSYDFASDEEVNNIEFYTVKSLKVEKCPYGNNFREECLIYKDELSCVNLFYDEKKYTSK